MATSTKNIIVGAADIFVSVVNGDTRPATTNTVLANLLPAGSSARQGLLQSSDYREVGYTSTGFEVSYEPSYGEVQVDQLLDAARLFKQTLKVTLKTELTEATLENLTLSWGQMDSYYVNQTGSTITAVPTYSAVKIQSSDSAAGVLNMAAGALGDAPTERTLIAVGNTAAYTDGSKFGSATSAQTGRQKERVYVARRVVSVDTTMHALKRDSATVFPVSFRCLPDDRSASYAGSEYGVVIDRVFGAL
jgi:hypothetical protein